MTSNTNSVSLSDLAGTCHHCGAKGQPTERWAECDTCDTCAYWIATARWGNGETQKRQARAELRSRRGCFAE